MKLPALIVIDVQQGFDDPYWGIRNNPNAETNIALLITHWRKNSGIILHVKHNSTTPESPLVLGKPGNEFMEFAKPQKGEPIFEKTVNSGFIGTNLEQYLSQNNIQQLVVCGFTTDHCVSTTCRMAANLGFDTTLAYDATMTFNKIGPDGKHYSADEVFNINIASLNEEFCGLKTTKEIIR